VLRIKEKIMIMMGQLEVSTVLLQPLETALAPATTAPVVVQDYFKKNTGVRFSTVFAEFKHRFFDRTERPAAAATYRKHKLLVIADDARILGELGCGTKVEGTLAAAFAFLQHQPKGEAGFLQTNGYANLFYMRDKKGELCAIRISWTSQGWEFDAIPVADPLAWIGEHVIICPEQPIHGGGLQILGRSTFA
jgi:hypothetical protein